MWFWKETSKQKLQKRTLPPRWMAMTLPEIAAYYSALNYDIGSDKSLSLTNRQQLRNQAAKYRAFLARRAPSPDPRWAATARRWNPLISVDGTPGAQTGSKAALDNIREQAKGQVARSAKANVIAKVRRRILESGA